MLGRSFRLVKASSLFMYMSQFKSPLLDHTVNVSDSLKLPYTTIEAVSTAAEQHDVTYGFDTVFKSNNH